MRINLGKLFLLLTLPLAVMAGEVTAKLSQQVIYRGDTVSFTLTAEGDDIVFPDITEIGIYPILGTSTQKSTTMINSDVTTSTSRVYTFQPKESIVVPSYTLEVDGEEKITSPLTLRVTKPAPSAKGDAIQVEMTTDKQEAYVGEPIRLKVTLKSLPNAHYNKAELSEPELKKFWVKKMKNLTQGRDGDYSTQSYTYILFPQEEGNMTIPAPFAQIGRVVQRQNRGGFFNDPFFGGRQMQWEKIYANALNVQIKPLPNGLDIYGDFSIRAYTDKQEVKANKPVNLTIEVKGIGNIEDIKKFDLDIEKAVVYSDEPKIFNSGPTRGVVEQKIAIVADRDFTIPAFSFSFFDKATQKEKTVTTQPITIKVTGSPMLSTSTPNAIEQKAVPKLERTQEEKSESNGVVKELTSSEKWWVYLMGFISGLFISFLTWFVLKKMQLRPKKEIPFIKQVKRAKTDKALFELLLPYKNDDPFIAEVLEQLEKNIYASGSETIDRDELLAVLEEVL